MNNPENRWVKTVTLTPPSIENNIADCERLANALKEMLNTDSIEIGLNLLQRIPACLRKWNYQAKCVLFKDKGKWILVSIFAPNSREKAFGLAIDLGTTTIDLLVCDLESGHDVFQASFENPQKKIGPDVLTRIRYAGTDSGLAELNELLVNGINEAAGLCCLEAGIKADHIHVISIAGNTAMTHFLLKLSPEWMIKDPYIPAVNRPGFFNAAELGLKASRDAGVFIFPNTGSYFGGDLIAGILFSGIYMGDEISMLVDIGTNAEVVLGNCEWLMGCAGAAGPALESGATRIGMTAGPGVVDKVNIDHVSRKVNVHTIENKMPAGICGSGLIDLLASLFISGMVDIRGKFVKSNCGNRIKSIDGIDHFILILAGESVTNKDLAISQPDIDSLIRSKAAMYAILGTITETVGMTPNDLQTFYIAGAFGNYINPESAVSIGMIPDLPLENYKPIGNSSLMGAALILKSDNLVDDVDDIRNRITYIELNVNEKFMTNFSGAKFLPHTDKSLFPSVMQKG